MSVNRFSKDAKLAKHIVPPRLLDVRRFMENVEDVLPSQYALAAQIVHVGESKHFGIIIFCSSLSTELRCMFCLNRSLCFARILWRWWMALLQRYVYPNCISRGWNPVYWRRPSLCLFLHPPVTRRMSVPGIKCVFFCLLIECDRIQ